MSSSYRFCFRDSESPTFANLSRYLQEQGWLRTRFNWRAHLNEKNFKFNLEAAKILEFKHLLAKLVSLYCPEVMPFTYGINDDNWPSVLNSIASQYYMKNNQLLDEVPNLVWILKPSSLNNGQQIKIFPRLSQIENHYLSTNRLGGEHVLQQYLSNPHLLKGHKYSIRMFVVITNYAGAFLYPYGYFNVALQPYEAKNFFDLSSHLTNEHLKEDESNVVQIPTQNFEFFPSFYTQIKSIISATLNGLRQLKPQSFICKKNPQLAIFGFDFMVDSDLRVWFLEANHGPCFPTSDEHPLQKLLYYGFWQEFITNFVLPIAKKHFEGNIQYHEFEQLM